MPKEKTVAEHQIYTKEQADNLAHRLHRFYQDLPDDEKLIMGDLLTQAAANSETSGFASPSAFKATTISLTNRPKIAAISVATIRQGIRVTW
jgi:hypothetical protein